MESGAVVDDPISVMIPRHGSPNGTSLSSKNSYPASMSAWAVLFCQEAS